MGVAHPFRVLEYHTPLGVPRAKCVKHLILTTRTKIQRALSHVRRWQHWAAPPRVATVAVVASAGTDLPQCLPFRKRISAPQTSEL